MNFTDKDLKWLKKGMLTNAYGFDSLELSWEKFEALIARLEAAEYALRDHAQKNCGACKAWRKRAGKSTFDESHKNVIGRHGPTFKKLAEEQ
jgi:hypothetical protein